MTIKEGLRPVLTAFLGVMCFTNTGDAAGSATRPGELAHRLVESVRYDGLAQMRSAGLERGQASRRPWSGWYWPFSEGTLAMRYGDKAFPRRGSWDAIRSYVVTNLGTASGTALSPAEKYDLLVGDPEFSLTVAMLRNANEPFRRGRLEPWMGYCTGLAAAGVNLPRPRKSVRLLAPDGVTWIEFLPDDIKALGALLWSTGSFRFHSVGTTCPKEPVQRDPVTQRPLDPDCRGVDPAVLHLALVNGIGFSRRALIIDADPGYQIWNHSVYSYHYRYFDPATGRIRDWRHAIRKRGSFKDRYSEYRTAGATRVVGIEMEIAFVYVRKPELRKTDAPSRDIIRKPVYRYDLEVDDSGRIVGGQWHSQLRPDVIWAPERGAEPETDGERLLGEVTAWNPPEAFPRSWTKAARESSHHSQPLRRIVETLFQLAR